MAFDEAKFRSAAKAAGYSDAEIESELKGAVPAGAAPAPSMDDTFAEKERALREEYDKKVKQATTSEVSIGDRTFEIPTFFTSPAGIVTAVGAGIGLGSTLIGAGAVAPKVYQSIKNRYMTKPPEIDRTRDIPMGGAFDTPPAPVAQPTPQATPDRVQQAQQLAEANRQLGIGGNQPVPPTAPVAAPVAPPEPISTPISAAPIEAPAPTPSAQPNSFATETIVNEVKDMIQKTPDPVTGAVAQPTKPVAPPQELLTGTGKPAFAGTGPEVKISKRTGKPQFKTEYASLADVPKGYAVVPNAQYVDVLRGIGQPEFTKAFTGKDFPTDYDQAVEATKEINRQLGRPTRAEAKAAGQPYGENIPGITQRTTENKKLVNVKGVGLGALVAIPDLVKAQTAGERGMAGANLLEAILPPGFMMQGAGQGSSTVPSVDAAMLLGSPYAQTEIAKKRRQEAEYTRKVGAGRGIAPPSAYMR